MVAGFVKSATPCCWPEAMRPAVTRTTGLDEARVGPAVRSASALPRHVLTGHEPYPPLLGETAGGKFLDSNKHVPMLTVGALPAETSVEPPVTCCCLILHPDGIAHRVVANLRSYVLSAGAGPTFSPRPARSAATGDPLGPWAELQLRN